MTFKPDFSDKALSLRRKPGPVRGSKANQYPPEKRIEVVTKWLALGNLRLTADLCDVKFETVKSWKASPWWNEIVAEVKASRNAVLDTKLSKIVDRALETIADRLENGNVKYDFKKQEAFREPVSIKDATSAAKALMDQQMQMEKLKVVETSAQATISVQDQIKMLAQEFAKFNTKRTISLEPPAEDVQFTDNGVSSEGDNDNAIHEEREEGLQEGSSSLYLETGSSEEEDGAERSTSDDGEGRTGT